MTIAKKVLTGIKRLNNSINGNPKYMLYFNYEVVRTPSDSMLAYKIDNSLIGKKLLITYHLTDKKKQAILDNFEIIN